MSVGYAQDVPFTQRLGNNINVKGNITFISNNILNRSSKDTPGIAKFNSTTGNYIIFNGDEDANVSYNSDLFYPINRIQYAPAGNGNLFMDYIDIDDDLTTFSSSKSNLNLPNCSRIAYAGLYWSGIYPYKTWENEETRENNFNSIKFKLPGQNYQDITGEIVYDNGIITQKPYLCYKDMTADINALSNPNGDYYAANIKATLGLDSKYGLGGTAGWILVVVYESESESNKNIAIFDGFSSVDGANYTDINFSGFVTTPSGPVRTKMLTASLEGDAIITGDAFQIQNNQGTFTNLSTTTTNPTNNFFNSSITKYDNYVTTRTPASENTLGFDVDLFDVNNPGNTLISNNQTSLNARFSTSGDVYWPFLVALAVETTEPEINLVETLDNGIAGNDIQGTALSLGADFWHNISFQNKGNEDANNTTIFKRLPENINLIEGDIIVPNGVTYNYTPPSSANNYKGEISFNIPNNLVEEGSSIHNIRLHSRVNSDCNNYKNACANLIQNQSFVSYEGINSGIQIENSPSFSGIDACNIGVAGSTNVFVDISGCNFTQDITSNENNTTLTAGEGFSSYVWKDNNGNTIGNSRSITINNSGTYTVSKTSNSLYCLSSDEIFNVTLTATTNPLINFADNVRSCTSNGLELVEIFLNGNSDSRTINTGITLPNTVTWQQLKTSCSSNTDQNCPNTDNNCWTNVSTNTNNTSRSFSEAGEYRVIIESETGDVNQYYFNVFKEIINPVIITEDIICSDSGSITINNVPNGYEFALTLSGNSPTTFQTSNVFSILTEGNYNVYIKNPVTSSIFSFPDNSISANNLDISVTSPSNLCYGDTGEINIQIDSNISGPYTYAILNSVNPITTFTTLDKNYSYSANYSGTYDIQVTTPECSVSKTVTLHFSDELNISNIVNKNIGCTDGLINLSASGGTNGYHYAVWSYTPATTATKQPISFTSISEIPSDNFFSNNDYLVKAGEEGNYEFIVIDNNNCSRISSTSTVTLETPLTGAYATQTDITCDISGNGLNLGSITFNPPSGGTPPYIYQYKLTTNASYISTTSNTITNLSAGSYDIKVQDTDGCQLILPNLTIAPTPTKPDFSYSVNYNCDGTGNIIVNSENASGSFFYSLNNNESNSTGVFNNLTAGTYEVTIDYGSSCSEEITFVIEENQEFSGTIISNTNTSCNGSSDGTITFNASNFITSYDYSIDGGTNWITGTSPTPTTINGLGAGNYSIILRNSNGFCEVSIGDAVIQELPALTISNVNLTKEITCNPNTGASFEIEAIGGTPPYEYSIDNGITFQTGSFTNIPTGNYNIIARDANGCSSSPYTYTVNPAENLSITSNATTCHNGSNGEITVIVNSGAGGYNFRLNGGAWLNPISFNSNTYTFQGITAGVYTIEVRDRAGCSASSIAEITPELQASATIEKDADLDNVTILATGGRPPYEYSSGNGSYFQSSNIFDGLTPGFYNLTVRDANGCVFEINSATDDCNIDEIGLTLTKEISCTTPYSEIELSILPESGIYEYEVLNSTGAYIINRTPTAYSGTVFPVSLPDTYTVNVYSLSGVSECSVSREITVQPAIIPDFTVNTTNPACNGEATGNIKVLVNQGTAPFSYDLTTSTGNVTSGIWNPNTNSFEDVSSGSYKVRVTGSNGCSFEINDIIINDNAPLYVPPLTTSNFNCSEGNNSIYPTISIDISSIYGGSGNYSLVDLYKSNPGNDIKISGALTNGNIRSYNITDTNGGDYYIKVIDSEGCEAISNTVTIYPFDELLAISTSQNTAISCTNGGELIDIVFNSSMSATGANITITDGTGTILETITNTNSGIHVTNSNRLTAGTYNITVTHPTTGCELSTIYIVEDVTNYIVNATVASPVTCLGTDSAEINIAFDLNTPYSGSYTYQVMNADTFTVTGISGNGLGNNNETISGLAAGNYFVELTMTSFPDCTIRTNNIIIDSPASNLVLTEASTHPMCDGESNGTINLNATGGWGGYEYQIEEQLSGIIYYAYSSENHFDNLPAGDYIAKVRDTNGCETFTSVNLIDPTLIQSNAVLTQDYTCTQTGIISFSPATGGTAPYSYGINGVYSSDLIKSNLTPDSYALSVRDANGCETQISEIIIEELQDIAPFITSEIAYNCDGSANITIINSGPNLYTYSLNGTSQSSNIFENIPPSAYIITVSDDNSCTYDLFITVENNKRFYSTLVSKEDAKCNNASNGAITIESKNFNNEYSYSIDGGITWQKTTESLLTIDGLNPGEYDVRTKAYSNETAVCEYYVDDVTIIDPPLLIATTAYTKNDVCDPNSLAEINVTATGGIPPYKFSIDNGATWQTSNIFTDVSDGTYQVLIKDNSNCSKTVFRNGSFEDINTKPDSFILTDASNLKGWKTTSPDNKIEVWKSGFNNTSASNGDYLVEINASIPSVLYQELKTTPGDIISWSFDHRGRTGVDSAEIRIGSSITTSAYGFSQTVSDGVKWGTYSGSYIVPVGQETTIIAFEAISSSSGNLSVGNFIDNVYFNVNQENNHITREVIIDETPPALEGVVIVTAENDIEFSSASGGHPPYQFSIDGGNTFKDTSIFSELSEGTYVPVIIDSNYCSITLNEINITNEDPSLVVSTISENIICTGDSNGSITVTVNGGAPPYTYTLFDYGYNLVNSVNSSEATYIFSNLLANNYIIQVTDSSGLTETNDNIIVSEPNQLFTTYTQATINSLHLQAAGGTPPYEYSIDGISYVTSSVFDNLPNNIYNISTRDANGCTSLPVTVIINDTTPTAVDDSFETTQESILEMDVLTNDYNIAVDGVLNFNPAIYGDITLSDPNGTPDDITDDILTYVPNPGFSGIDTFTYFLCDNDHNCASAEVTILVKEKPLTIDQVNVTDATCDSPEGRVEILVSGGVYPYHYEISDSSGTVITNTTSNIISVSPGFYTLNITDSYGEVIVTDFSINDPSSFDVNLTVTNNNCSDEYNGKILVDVINGVPPYTYALNGDFLQTNNEFTNLTGGTYTIDVVDANNCTVSKTVILEDPLPIVSTTNITGNTITINTTGGIPPYEYSIDGGNTFVTSFVFTNLNEDSYDAVVKDSNGCYELFPIYIASSPATIDDSATTIKNTPVIIPILANDSNVSLNDFITFSQPSNGNISIENNGTSDDISDDLITYQPDPSFVGNDSFTYTLCDRNNPSSCSTATVTIIVEDQPETFDITFSTSHVTCNGSDNGIVGVFLSGGTPPYSYDVLGVTSRISNDTVEVFNNLSPNTYTVTVTDSYGITATREVTIIEPSLLAATITTTDITCNGSDDGSIVINAIGGTGNYVYNVSPVGATSGTLQSENTFNNLSAGVYDVTIQDENGCFQTLSAVIIEPSPLVISSIEITPSGNEPSGVIIAGASGGTAPYSFSLNGDIPVNSNEFIGLAPGTYAITSIDSNGCISTEFTVTLNEIDIDNSVTQNEEELEVTFKNATAYQWINVDSGERIAGATESSYKPTVSGRYQVEITVTQEATEYYNGQTSVKNNSNTQIVLSPIIEFKIDTLSTENIEKTDFTIYPNPTTEIINVPTELIGKKYKIYNILGEEIYNDKIESTKLNVQSLSDGVYFIKIPKYTPVKFVKH